MNSTNQEQLLNILSLQTNDISGCLTNCSSNGQCKLNSLRGFYTCACEPYFIGPSCQYDTRPCSSTSPCLNNGTCSNQQITNATLFECQCQTSFYGTNCEKQINICQNETCNKNGYCYNSQNEPKCKCFTGYLGDKCDLISSQIQQVKTIQSTSSIICFIIFATMISMVILNDIMNCFIDKKKKRSNKNVQQESSFIRYKYQTKFQE